MEIVCVLLGKSTGWMNLDLTMLVERDDILLRVVQRC
jgi:hypothetical protein